MKHEFDHKIEYTDSQIVVTISNRRNLKTVKVRCSFPTDLEFFVRQIAHHAKAILPGATPTHIAVLQSQAWESHQKLRQESEYARAVL